MSLNNLRILTPNRFDHEMFVNKGHALEIERLELSLDVTT